MNTYEEAREYLFNLLPMYQRQGGKSIKKGLERTRELCWHLGMPHWKFPSIHVAGTNGKGSVSSMLTSILMEAGYKVGLYTSPHLKDFTERIRINGEPVDQEDVRDFVWTYQELIEQVKPSFFELTVAMAFDFFAEEEVDIAIVEVGLGGRLDSTNIIKPELSVITNISYDHMDMLGDTLGDIANEKAGIIKNMTPVIVGQTHIETREVFQWKADMHQAPLHFADQIWDITPQGSDLHEQSFAVKHKDSKGKSVTIQLDLAGNYQAQNLATCLQTVEVFREYGWEVPIDAVKRGLAHVQANSGLAGRMQVIQEKPMVVCDTAHNEAGVKAVLGQLSQTPHHHLHLVWGMVQEKDHDKILKLLPKDAKYYFVRPNVPRGLDAYLLKQKAADHGLEGEVFANTNEALVQVVLQADPYDLVYVGGSTFVVAEAI
ncbi:MAG: folylpolyglutamate synthase/dihydrofolate synthase family protein [Bacteroidota bacterium]